MARLVECVPNFSEGRDMAVVDAIAARVSGTPGVQLLDRTSDRDHNRSVLTFAGEAQPVTRAMEAAVEEALARIDMRVHEGQHPRVGAVERSSVRAARRDDDGRVHSRLLAASANVSRLASISRFTCMPAPRGRRPARSSRTFAGPSSRAWAS